MYVQYDYNNIYLSFQTNMVRHLGDVFTESQRRWSHRVGSPWMAMVFLSCRIVFPADTCTVTVLVPSWENVHDTLPSRVISGCWERKRERERERERERKGREAGHVESQSLGTLI